MKSWRNILLVSLPGLLFLACATHYELTYDFNKNFERGNLDDAIQSLESRANQRSYNRDRFLMYVNKGLVYSMKGKYEDSNYFLEKAYIFGEDYSINYISEVAVYLSNPGIVVYRGEDHEHLMLLYYKAINFLKMGKYEQALVECRRLNIRLNQLSDKYSSEKKYSRDAFIHNLMGIIYQANNDYNNAFIAYRNAYNYYHDDYNRLFGLQAPEQLKKDLLFTARRSGLRQEFEFYQNEFIDIDISTLENTDASLVFFWHNGLAPFKAEWSVNFFMDHSRNGFVVFNNDQMNMHFPFWMGEYQENEQRSLSSMQAFRVAFPKYVERKPVFNQAQLIVGDKSYQLQLAQDINKIAFYTLEQRMMLEFSKSLARAAIKKGSEMMLRKEDETLGAVLGLFNALTEKADTRNWQTLPYAIHYARIPLNAGINEARFHVSNTFAGSGSTYDFRYKVKSGETLFHTFSSLESRNN
jgi:uncharacterized protein